MSRGPRPTEPRMRFWAKVDKSGDCWDWRGYLRKSGYGQFAIAAGISVYAHRFSYEDTVGPIPEGLQIDHVCHRRSCVNPSHLRVVTHKQNSENHTGARIDNRLGVRNVGLNRRTGRYRVNVMHNGRNHFRGEFNTVEEAAEAARQLRLSLYTHNELDRRSA